MAECALVEDGLGDLVGHIGFRNPLRARESAYGLGSYGRPRIGCSYPSHWVWMGSGVDLELPRNAIDGDLIAVDS